jgi:carbon-monoxide dehydrogenase medium subunit
MHPFEYSRPTTLEEAVLLLNKSGHRIVAGGTDVIPRLRLNHFEVNHLVDISRLEDLRYIEERGERIFIGALVNHQAIVDSALLNEVSQVLVEASSSVGCRQTRIQGTLGGNLANASPAADTSPALLVLNTDVHIISQNGSRTIALNDFFTGPGRTCLLDGEIIHSISFSRLQGRWGSNFQKLGKRSGMAIAVASAAAVLVLGNDGVIRDVRLAFGSVAPKPVRSPAAESVLLGMKATSELISMAAEASMADISPISDVRSTSEYRGNAAKVLAQRALQAAFIETEERQVA